MNYAGYFMRGIKRNLFHLMALLSVIFVHPCATAQEGDDGKREKVTFCTASWEPMDDSLFYLKGGTGMNSEFEMITLTEMVRSLPYETKADGSLTLYKKADPEGYVEAVSVGLPPVMGSEKRYLLLFLPKQDGRYQVKVFNDSREDSPFGAYDFYNLSGFPINGMLGDKRFEIPKGDHKLIKLDLEPGSAIPFATLSKVQGKYQWLQRNTFHFNPKKHSKFFLHKIPTANGKFKIEAKAIVEFEPDAPLPDE